MNNPLVSKLTVFVGWVQLINVVGITICMALQIWPPELPDTAGMHYLVGAVVGAALLDGIISVKTGMHLPGLIIRMQQLEEK